MKQILDFMQNIVGVWDRLKRFDFKELTFTQIFFGITGILVALWIFGQILSFILGILNIVGPLALVSMVLFMGYRWSQSRAEDLPDEMKKSKKQRKVDEALANVQANLDDSKQADTSDDNRIEVSQAEEVTVEIAEEDNLVVKQIINPETGFKEPDLSRLIEYEEAKLKEADQVNDDIMAQIEARRNRLKNQQ